MYLFLFTFLDLVVSSIAIFELERFLFDKIPEDNMHKIILNIYSINCYCLFLLNSLHISLFYFDLK